MSIWLTALKAVPWTDVIAAAPAVARGARKLFKRPAREVPAADLVFECAAFSVDGSAGLDVLASQSLIFISKDSTTCP